MQVRCPHCHNPIELVDDAELSDVACPSCGSSFNLLGEQTLSYERGETKSIAHFELQERVGMGAFGSVWKAEDTKLDRTVAIKIPRKEQLTPAEAEQFLREARSAAQLKHPNIVSVYEVGLEDGQTYIVSDFVEGLTLSSWLTGQKLTSREAAELCAKLADALHHAHEAGVIHRDLKPSNIMLDLAGEPHITDFGLAKRETGEITMTLEGKVLGTPAYMSPEQAGGEAHRADRRSDVYSLGVILFELLTGEKPFRGDARMLIHQVLNEDPPSPRDLNNSIPRDLETICLKCLEKERRNRYCSASDLAEDLGRFLNDQTILARPPTMMGKFLRWLRQNALLAAGAYLFFYGLVVTIAVAFGMLTYVLGNQAKLTFIHLFMLVVFLAIPMLLSYTGYAIIKERMMGIVSGILVFGVVSVWQAASVFLLGSKLLESKSILPLSGMHFSLVLHVIGLALCSLAMFAELSRRTSATYKDA